MTRRSRTRAFAVVLTLATALTLVAAPAVAQSGADKVQTTKFTVTLTSEQTVLHEVGADGTSTYGWNRLAGEGATDSGDVSVEMLGNVQYVDGAGPIFGFVTLEFASSSDVGFRMRGKATKDSSGTTHFTGKLKVIGGTAALNQVNGTGSFTGTRRDDLGGAVELDVTVKLRGVDI